MKATADRCFNVFSPRYWLGQLDLRPLGLMRVAFGAALFIAIADIGPLLLDFFSEKGVAPRTALLGPLGVRNNRFSIFDMAGPNWVVIAFYVITLLAVLSFTVGFHSRASSVLTFFMVCGLHERDLMLFDGSDNVIRVMLFWLMFMPTGARYSVDASLRHARGLPLITHGTALPMRMGQLQIAWIYLNTAIHKWGGVSWHNGNALRIALGLDHLFTRPLGKLLYDIPFATRFGTHMALAIEIAFLPLVLLPIWKPAHLETWLKTQSRTTQRVVSLFFQPTYKALAILGGMSLHIGIALTMSVGDFSYIMITSYVLLYEPEWAEAIVRVFGRVWGRGVTKVLYDGECAMCARLAAILGGFDFYGNLELVNFRKQGALAGISNVPRGALSQQIHVVDSNGKLQAGYPALLRIARRVPAFSLFGVLGAAPGAQQVGSPLYEKFTAHRPQPIPETPHREPPESWWTLVPSPLRRVGAGLLYVALVVLLFHIGWFSLPEDGKWILPAQARLGPVHFNIPKVLQGPYDVSPKHMDRRMFRTIQEIELWQKWDMFSPEPLGSDIYLEGRGHLVDGTQVDVLRGDVDGGPLPPKYPGFFFSRWSKYINNIAYGDEPWKVEFGKYLCRRWNSPAPPGRPLLKDFKLYRESRKVPLIGEKPTEWVEDQILEQRCF
jgi:predicted DCC family thiol-disulfide oxidoreductase YuxK